MTDYLAFHNSESESKRIDFVAERIKYTITEGLKIFEIALANRDGSKTQGKKFWKEVEARQILPNRPGESMRNFWKTQTKRGLENFLNSSIKSGDRYYHAFKVIPKNRPQTIQKLYEEAKQRLFDAAEVPYVKLQSLEEEKNNHNTSNNTNPP